MAAPDFPLRWESSGDQWWYASPIDWAAANGYYDLVRELLRQDANLLIKLTSLRRIRRLETVWDDDSQSDAARCRALVAQSLFRDCETRDGNNTLIRAGYGGWLLYAAAAAGDVDFVYEILHRDPLLVFGEGEYGVTDVLYAAARSGDCEIFRVLYDHAISPRCWGGIVEQEVEEQQESGGGKASIFRWEMLNRAVHATARGGNLKILREFLGDCSDVLAYRDGQGSTLLHAASGRGRVQVVEDLIKSFDIINSKDNQGNTALHVAAYRGHLSVVKALILADPSSIFETNKGGDTFLHMAVTGFKSPGFRRLDNQMELMKNLADGSFVDLSPVINLQNNDGRTALHIAVTGNTHSNLVELLMPVPSINLNIRDNDGVTPLDLLNLRSRSASSGILIKELISAGGISNMKDYMTRNAVASQLKMQGICGSPGTSFRISDSEILLYAGMENASEISGDRESTRASSNSSPSKSELSNADNISTCGNLSVTKRSAAPSVGNAARHLKALLGWSRRREKKTNTTSADSMRMVVDTDSLNSCRKFSFMGDIPIPLRLRYTNVSSLPSNKRALAMETSLPSASTKEKFTAGLVQGVIQSVPDMNSPTKTSSRTPLSSSPGRLNKHCDSMSDGETGECSLSKISVDQGMPSEASNKMTPLNNRLMNEYFCFGAQGLNVEEPVPRRHSDSVYKQSALSVA